MTAYVVKRYTLTSMALATLTEHPFRMPKVKINLLKIQLLLIMLLVLQRKQNVSHLERIPTCHHCGIKGHIQPHCNKLRSLPTQKQWKMQKAEMKKKNMKVVWVKKEKLSSVLVHTLLKYLNL